MSTDALMKWEPIETAPKDGRTVILYRPGYRNKVFLGWYEYDKLLKSSYFRSVGRSDVGWDATHWMVIPEGPK